MPGLSEHLASAKHPSCVPLAEAVFTVSLITLPPSIRICSRDTRPNFPRDPILAEIEARKASSKLERAFRDQGHESNGMPAVFEVESMWGGGKRMLSLQLIPSDMQLFQPGRKYAEGAEVDNAYLCRKPAKDENGNNLAFVLDEVDKCTKALPATSRGRQRLSNDDLRLH